MRGQMIIDDDAGQVLFLGSPWFTDIADLEKSGLVLRDFTIQDPIIDFLYMVQARTVALEAAEQGLGVALAMNPLIRGRRGFGRTLIAPFDLPAPHMQTLYVVTRTEQAKDRRIVACKRWLTAAVKQASA